MKLRVNSQHMDELYLGMGENFERYLAIIDEQQEDQQNMLQILYLLDRFGVGDLFYHELAMLNPSFPRLHTVKGA